MSNIHIISASAGTGKTFQLTEVLFEKICSGVQPEAILATTFTNKAADELKSRIRTRLVREGQVDTAQRLDAALIGTVNSVCGQLVHDYAFPLGVSPEATVLDETPAKTALKEVIARVATQEQMEELDALSISLSGIDWQADVQNIVNLARANNIAEEDLAGCAERSIQEFSSLLPSAGRAEQVDSALSAAMAEFLDKVEEDGVKKTASAIELVRAVSDQVGAGRPLVWQDWLRLAKLDPAKKQAVLAEPVKRAALAHGGHPQLRSQCEAVIRLVFSLAAEALGVYQQHKAEFGAIDFVDQEVFALRLLGDESVREELRGRLGLVLVDEFQDTSPIQLAIFLKLATLADESVWVGDQKQSIYGFRGTDPALMDAAIESIESAGGKPDILKESWRSRPDLVDATSEVFAKAFARVGIPEERVRITSALKQCDEPAGLGPVLESWSFDAGRKKFDAAGVATGIRELLGDGTVRVRDRSTGEARTIRPEDVAVLCDTNKVCDAMAAELARAGVPAHREHAGLLATPEARLVLSGLCYFVDHGDSLAVAELARALEFPESGDDLLDALVAKPKAAAFEDMAVLNAIRNSRRRNPAAGAVAVLDMVIDDVQAREMCLRWGDSRTRMDNLDALRMHAVNYAGSCEEEGAGCTAAGLIAYLAKLAEDGADKQALLPGGNMVTVSTWHGAKGCEWPVTVLSTLESDRRRTPLGVTVASDRATFDIDDPLAERWVRFWPNPYHPSTSRAAFFERLTEHEASQDIAEKDERERLRLLYVIWTRARDRLVLATNKGQLEKGLLSLLRDGEGQALLSRSDSGEMTVAGNVLAARERALAGIEDVATARAVEAWYRYPASLPVHPPAVVSPSDLEACGKANPVECIGERLPLAGQPDMASVGNAVHGFLAADRQEADPSVRRALAADVLSRWGLPGVIEPDALLASSDSLSAWIERNWPGATWNREWPVMMRRDDGTVVSGIADLVLETEDGFVVIDHKTFPGNREQAVERASGHAGQLAAYSTAIVLATGRTVTDMFIHLPVSGLVIPVTST